jgi:hypothetical protein
MTYRPSPSLIVSFLALLVSLGGVGLAANGGPFLLGSGNTATAPTSLSAPIAGGRTLRVVNTSTAAGSSALALTVGNGRPPMIVNSDARVVNLNADMLDNLHADQLVRVGRGYTQNGISTATFTTKAEVTLDIPVRGFVLLNGQVSLQTSSNTCNPCYLQMQFRDETSMDASLATITSLGNGVAIAHNTVLTSSWVFPVAPGERTFALQTGGTPGDPVITFNPAVTALFIPFGPDGTKDLGSPPINTLSTKTKALGPVQRNGIRAILP